MAGRISMILHDSKPAMIMVVVQIAMAGLNILLKLAADDGMSLSIWVAYRFLFAAAFMVPLALWVERNTRHKLTWKVLFEAFLCGLFGGTVAQNLYAKSLVLTSPTFATAMSNLIPAFSYFIAISIGLEKPGLGTNAGKAKMVGTFLAVGGAMLLTFYKGVQIKMWSTLVNLSHEDGHVSSSQSKQGLGSFLIIVACLSASLSLNIQAKLSEAYPCHYSSTALIAVMGSIQSVLFAICTEKNWNQWKLGWDIRLLTVAYSGIVASGLAIILMMWCVRIKGPVFVSVFGPLMLVLVAIAGSLVFNEKLHLGSVLGAVVIVCGLYLVLWGKSKETKKKEASDSETGSNIKESEEIKIGISNASVDSHENSEIVLNRPLNGLK